MLEAVIAGVAAFVATNLDDLFLLMLYFSEAASDPQRERSIVTGQYLGFSVLVVVSVVGYLGSLLIPRPYVGLLGVLPIVLGIRRLWRARTRDEARRQPREARAQERATPKIARSRLLGWLNPQAAGIAAVTVASGSDNLALYKPLFAAGGLTRAAIMILVLLVMVRVWCLIADSLAENPVTAAPLRRFGRVLMPFVLVGIGLTILLESGGYDLFI